MMSAYSYVMPQVFNWMAVVSPSDARKIANILIGNRAPGAHDFPPPEGSSFAVTVDFSQRGKRRLWASDTSHQRIVMTGKFQHVIWVNLHKRPTHAE